MAGSQWLPLQDSRHDINAPDPGPSSDIPSLEAPLPETEILDDLAAVSQLDAWLRAARPDDDRITGKQTRPGGWQDFAVGCRCRY